MIAAEAHLHQKVCDYIRMHYPDVIFRTDFAAGIKMTIGQAARHKRLQQSRAFPDLSILEPRKGFHGLFIELKAKNIYKRNGELLSDPHVHEQAKMLNVLKTKGYLAHFACGFDEARALIDDYLVS